MESRTPWIDEPLAGVTQGTSLVAVIAFDELLRTAKVAGETEREPFIFFLAAGVLYLLMTWVSDQTKIRLENRVSLAGRN